MHTHNHSHDHHGHDHPGHHHAAPDMNRAFLIGIGLNVAFIVAEIGFGLKAHSLSLLADAGHNVSDVLGLFMAWAALWASRLKPTARYTYGFRSSSILAALANAALLLVATGGIAWEAILKIFDPQPVEGGIVMAVAAVGIIINGGTALMFMRGHNDLNVRGAFLHMAADAGVSAGVVLAGLLILKTGWNWLDPLIGLAIAVIIVRGTWGLLKDSVGLALHGVPRHIDAAAVRAHLATQPGVQDVHDLHIWAMSTSEVALSAHLRIDGAHPGNRFLRDIADGLQHQFGIGHTTIQLELCDDAECALSAHAA